MVSCMCLCMPSPVCAHCISLSSLILKRNIHSHPHALFFSYNLKEGTRSALLDMESKFGHLVKVEYAQDKWDVASPGKCGNGECRQCVILPPPLPPPPPFNPFFQMYVRARILWPHPCTRPPYAYPSFRRTHRPNLPLTQNASSFVVYVRRMYYLLCFFFFLSF